MARRRWKWLLAAVAALGLTAATALTDPNLEDLSCKNGSMDSPTGGCFIRAGDRVIALPDAFRRPTGGRVLATAEAAARFPNRCLDRRRPLYVIVGSDGADRIRGTREKDVILAGAGNDVVNARRHDDCIAGGPGDDLLIGGEGLDELYAGDGDDRLLGGQSPDYLAGGAGADRLSGGRGSDTIAPGSGRDRVLGGPHPDSVDAAVVGAGVRSIRCGAGFDRLRVWPWHRGRASGCESVTVVPPPPEQ